ncbi:MAG: S1 family peptidase, partial [Pseudomonadota bacterium]
MTTLRTFTLLASLAAASVCATEINVSEEKVEAFIELENRSKARFEQIPIAPAGEVSFELINGRVVDRRIFPAILRMTTGGTCTATLVGPSTVLLAAHCIDYHYARVEFVFGDQEVVGICEHAPGWGGRDESHDWALCLLQREVSGLAYESVDVYNDVEVGSIVMLTGYGCTTPGGPLDNLLRIGTSKVVERPEVDWLPLESSTIYAESNLADGEAVLCPGDSGGPAFIVSGGL